MFGSLYSAPYFTVCINKAILLLSQIFAPIVNFKCKLSEAKPFLSIRSYSIQQGWASNVAGALMQCYIRLF